MKKKILITVKTYPTYSTKYDELVCTAGVDEDGKWWRLYPIPFRKLQKDTQYKKYDWVEVDAVNHSGDPRPESLRLVDMNDPDAIKVVGKVEPKKEWKLRDQYCLANVYTNMSTLIADSNIKGDKVSLATFKPAKFISCKAEPNDVELSAKQKASLAQQSMFSDVKSMSDLMPRIPFKFKYTFIDEDGKQSSMRILDWELNQLYLNVKRRKGTDEAARLAVIEKYSLFMNGDYDTHLFLGTTQSRHGLASNPFTIIGVYYPKRKKSDQISLFG